MTVVTLKHTNRNLHGVGDGGVVWESGWAGISNGFTGTGEMPIAATMTAMVRVACILPRSFRPTRPLFKLRTVHLSFCSKIDHQPNTGLRTKSPDLVRGSVYKNAQFRRCVSLSREVWSATAVAAQGCATSRPAATRAYCCTVHVYCTCNPGHFNVFEVLTSFRVQGLTNAPYQECIRSYVLQGLVLLMATQGCNPLLRRAFRSVLINFDGSPAAEHAIFEQHALEFGNASCSTVEHVEVIDYERTSVGIDYLTERGALSEDQYGFRKGRSCPDLLLTAVDDWCLAKDAKQYTAFVDLSKAFDYVWHDLLLQTLQSHGLGGTVLKWFHHYLTDRQQCIVLQNPPLTFNCSKGDGCATR